VRSAQAGVNPHPSIPASTPGKPRRTHRRELEEHVAAGGAEQQALECGQLLHGDGPRHKAQLHRLWLVRLRALQQRGTYTGGGAGACGSGSQAAAGGWGSGWRAGRGRHWQAGKQARTQAGMPKRDLWQSPHSSGTSCNTSWLRCSSTQALTVGVGRSGRLALRTVRRGAGVLKEGARPLQHQLRSENGCSRAGMVRMLVRSWIAHDVSARANLQRPAWCL